MNILIEMMAWVTGQTMDGYSKSVRTKYVTTRHPTKKGPGRSLGRDPMAASKKALVRNGGTLVKHPKHIPSGISPQGRYAKGQNPIGTNVRA